MNAGMKMCIRLMIYDLGLWILTYYYGCDCSGVGLEHHIGSLRIHNICRHIVREEHYYLIHKNDILRFVPQY